MASIFRAINSLIPFTEPSTPLWQDLVHTIVLCTVLWFGPQVDWQGLQARILRRQKGRDESIGQIPVNREDVGEEADEEHEAGVGAGAGAEDEEWQDPTAFDDFAQREGARNPVPDPPLDAAFPPADFDGEHNLDAAGPANPNQPARRNVAGTQREVGAKKAKSLARRNQQRAYNEFLREQGEAERAEWARDAAVREEELKEERRRRMVVEAAIAEKERREREARKVKEEEERREELDAIKEAGELVRVGLDEDGFFRCEDLARRVGRDRSWVEKLVRREGVLGAKSVMGRKEVTLLTGRGYVVRVDDDIMRLAYKTAAEQSGKGDGKVSWEQLGLIIQKALTERVS